MKTYATRLEMIDALPPCSVGAEVGVWRGYFASEVLRNTAVAKLFLVDSWVKQTGVWAQNPINAEDHEANLHETEKNVSGFGTRAQIIRGMSLDVAASDKIPPLDFVYLDAAHDYASVLADLRAWSKKLAPYGVLMGHDFTEHAEALALGFGVVAAVNAFCVEEGWHITAQTNETWASFCIERKPPTAWYGAEL